MNNAGVIKVHQIFDGVSIEEVERVMAANTLGAVRVSKAFIPILNEKKGSRIVLVSSISAHLTIPLMTSYCMSKHALRSFGDGLRREIKRLGIHVSMIESTVYE